MKVSTINSRWILAEGVGYYLGTAVHPQESDARSDLSEGVYDAMAHQALTLDHISDCSSALRILEPVPPAVVTEWGFGSCSTGQSGASSTTTIPSSTTVASTTSTGPPTTTTTTAPPGSVATSSLDLGAIAGSWGAHEQSLNITSGGQGTLSYADLGLCPTCSEGGAPTSTVQFQLTSGNGTSASGTVTAASNPQEYQVGESVGLQVTTGSPGQILNVKVGSNGGGMYCNSTSYGQCGA